MFKNSEPNQSLGSFLIDINNIILIICYTLVFLLDNLDQGLSETIAILALDPPPKAFTKLEELHRSHCDSRDSTL